MAWFISNVNWNERMASIDDRLDRILELQELTVALVSIQQESLDEIATTVSEAADDLQGILDSDTPTPPADETAIRAAIEKLQAVGPKTEPEPEPEPPVE